MRSIDFSLHPVGDFSRGGGWMGWRTMGASVHFSRFTMLYKFKSAAAGDLIMLEPNGRQVLQLIGKDAGPKGIILPEEMAAAAAALEAAIASDEQARAEALKKEQPRDAAKPEAVSLRQRAAPFVAMLKRCEKEDKEIVWGV